MNESTALAALAAACVRAGGAAHTGPRGLNLVVDGADLTHRVSVVELMDRSQGRFRSRSFDPPRYRVRVDVGVGRTDNVSVSVRRGVFDWDDVASRLLEVAPEVRAASERVERRRSNRDAASETRASLGLPDDGPFRVYASDDSALPVRVTVSLDLPAVTPERAREILEGLRALGLMTSTEC